VQDEDVLDTWFSSWLWPFSTLGWPEETEDLEVFFPTSALVTAYDIIFFWVARMIMASMEFMGRAPFRDIYITGLIRDKQGRKMSKSLGNGIDPLDVVEEFGADAHKFTLAFLATSGQDILLEKDDFHFGSKFANKIWNASRYILMNLEGRTLIPREELTLGEVDRWIYHRLNAAAAEVHRSMEAYRFSNATQAVYEYFWSDFCDWYIEATKLSLYSDDEAEKDRGVSLLIYVLEESLRLLHPFMSFITEEIFAQLPHFPGKAEAVIIAPYPRAAAEREAPRIATQFASLQELVRLVRTLRSEFTIPPQKRIVFEVKFEEDFPAGAFLERQVELIRMLTGAEQVGFTAGGPSRDGSIALVGVGFECYVYVRDVIDVSAQVSRLEKNRQKAAKQLDSTRRKLENPGFLQNAGEEVVAKEREKEQELARQVEKLDLYLAELGS
jgi:valyl-tRNA synthetase